MNDFDILEKDFRDKDHAEECIVRYIDYIEAPIKLGTLSILFTRGLKKLDVNFKDFIRSLADAGKFKIKLSYDKKSFFIYSNSAYAMIYEVYKNGHISAFADQEIAIETQAEKYRRIRKGIIAPDEPQVMNGVKGKSGQNL